MGPEDDIDPRRLVEDRVLVHLREAAADGDLHALALVLAGLQVAERAIELPGRVVADRAGVDDDDVGLFAELGSDIAGTLERPGESLGVVDVHLTAERPDLVGARTALGSARGGRGRDRRGCAVEQSHDDPILRLDAWMNLVAPSGPDACAERVTPALRRGRHVSGTKPPTRPNHVARRQARCVPPCRRSIPRNRGARACP